MGGQNHGFKAGVISASCWPVDEYALPHIWHRHEDGKAEMEGLLLSYFLQALWWWRAEGGCSSSGGGPASWTSPSQATPSNTRT